LVTTILNNKGGVGKTTLAVNLAIALAHRGQDVLLVDGDEQATALNFTQIRYEKQRERPQYTAVALHGAAIHSQVRELASRYSQVIIDVGGRDNKSMRAGIVVAEMVIVPTAPRSFDLWGVEQTRDIIRGAREFHEFTALAVLNGADSAGSDNQAALEALAELGDIEVSPHTLVRRKAYPNSTARGLSVIEHSDPRNRDGCLKAREEFKALFESLFPVAQPIPVEETVLA
jgi:chromosome partitioning protein